MFVTSLFKPGRGLALFAGIHPLLASFKAAHLVHHDVEAFSQALNLF
jgi:hypothetical protein